MNYQEINVCRSCKNKSFKKILSFGNLPLANSLRTNLQLLEDRYPLVLIECQSCTLVQLSIDVNSHTMFDNYDWVTGTSRMAKDSARNLFEFVNQILPVSLSDSKVCEIASNDGTFLLPFKNAGSKTLGVEPAGNLSSLSNKLGIPTLNKYFSSSLASDILEQYGVQDLVIARNVLAHVPDPDDFTKGIATLIGDRGFAYVEVHNGRSIFEGLQYDAIYHEHASYFSEVSLNYLCLRNDLTVFKIVESRIGGGNLGFFLKSRKNKSLKELPSLNLEEGKSSALDWESWALKVENHRNEINAYLEGKEFQSGVGFGASARGSTLLNYCRFDQKLKGVLDNNEFKHGKYVPGLPLKISKVSEMASLNPEYVFGLAWNFENEMIEQLKELKFSGEILIPFPTIRRVEL